MEVLILPDAEAVAEAAADRIAKLVAGKPDAVLGVATGSSPLLAYAALARRVRTGTLNLSRIQAFALDEYVGLSPGHPQSYAATLRRDFAEPLGLEPHQVAVPDGNAADPAWACAAFERALRDAGGVDLQLLGIGANGHVGFNEPTSSLTSRTRLKTLATQTREDNARFFTDSQQVPFHCLTQGLGTILDARSLMLVAQGAGKAQAVAAAVEGPLTAMVPASILQLHPHTTILLDEAASSRLTLSAYYRHTAANRPGVATDVGLPDVQAAG